MVGVPSAYLMGSRGCLSACDYCCISTLHRMVPGKRFRQRSTEDIVAEMASLYHERGVRQFIFHDDNFLVPNRTRNLERIEALDRGMRKNGIRRVGLVLKCRPADVDRELFLRLREMGLLRVFLGIESGSEAGLASLGRRQTVEDEHRALSVCEELGISTQYTIISFHPEATPQTLLDDLAFVRRHATQPMSYCRAEIYAGTPLEERMLRAGRARGDYLARVYDYTHPLLPMVWSAARELLNERCWTQVHLLGRSVRLDHQVAVFRHFYEGRQVDALAEAFETWKLSVNLDTVGLIEDLLHACVEFGDASHSGFQRRLADLKQRETATRRVFDAQSCTMRENLRRLSFEMIGMAVPSEPTSLRENRALHAAAVVLALGIASCDGGNSSTMGFDDGGTKRDALPKTDTPQYRDSPGVFEAPPPPMRDAAEGVDTSVVDTAKADAGTSDVQGNDARLDALVTRDAFVYRDQGGVYEAPPPPLLDAAVKRD
jgi:hypothetical protein